MFGNTVGYGTVHSINTSTTGAQSEKNPSSHSSTTSESARFSEYLQ